MHLKWREPHYTKQVLGKEVKIRRSRGFFGWTKFTRKWARPEYEYQVIPFVPAIFATRTWMRVRSNLIVLPPEYSHYAYYPEPGELVPGVGVAIAKSPRVTVTPAWILSVLGFLVFTALGGYQEPILLVALALALAVFVWLIYIIRLHWVTVGTHNSITKYRGVWAWVSTESVQGDDITAVKMRVPSPKLWHLLLSTHQISVTYLGSSSVTFGDSEVQAQPQVQNQEEAPRRFWQKFVKRLASSEPTIYLNSVGNGEILETLLKSIQTDTQDKRAEANELAKQTLQSVREIADEMKLFRQSLSSRVSSETRLSKRMEGQNDEMIKWLKIIARPATETPTGPIPVVPAPADGAIATGDEDSFDSNKAN